MTHNEASDEIIEMAKYAPYYTAQEFHKHTGKPKQKIILSESFK